MKSKILIISLFFFVLSACVSEKKQTPILASVENKNIYLEDFKDRAELTIRPALFKDAGDQKRLILNTLIAEKILALEAEKNINIRNNEKLAAYVTGIKEQKMRSLHYKKNALDHVKVDEQTVQKISDAAGRIYQLQHFDVSSAVNYDSLNSILQKQPQMFEQTFNSIYPGQKIPQQHIGWKDVFNTELFDALYVNRTEPGQLIGPVKRSDDRVFFFKVDSWENRVISSETEITQIKDEIGKYLQNAAAGEKYEQVVAELMAGKSIVFETQGLIPLINMLGPVLLREDSDTDFLNDPSQRMMQEVRLDSLRNSSGKFESQIVLRVNDKRWTIDKILAEMTVHPLVFRQKKFAKKEFGEQLKFALADMIRDRYLTEDAYEKGYDKDEQIQRSERLWRDYFYTVMMREQLLSQKNDGQMNDLEYLDRKVRDLRNAYKERIQINEKMLAETDIADVQLFALQKNVPFPLATPGFPLLTLDDR
ncbi:MAG: hypothetical protein H6627_08475 [Calditrichae bacterium]|nr:hypothetical protein [Calditrichia bacterium]